MMANDGYQTDYSMSNAGMDDFETAMANLMESCKTKFETTASQITGVADFGEETLLADENAKAVKSIVDSELANLSTKIKDIIEANSANSELVKENDKVGKASFDDFSDRNKPTPA